jgi:hypothetical protein
MRNAGSAFGTELLDDGGWCEIGHKHCRDEHRDYDELRAVDDDIAARANDWRQKRENALKGELQELDQAGESKAGSKSDELRPDRYAPVPKESVT